MTVSRSRLRLRDLVREATLSTVRHPGRSALTAMGTVLGAAAFVATLGLSSTISQQVTDAFDVCRATEVLVETARPELDPEWNRAEQVARVGMLNGVVQSGARVLAGQFPVARDAVGPGEDLDVMGADPGAVAVMAPRITVGRTFDPFHEAAAVPVALLPASAAAALEIDRVGGAVFIDDRPFVVIGIFDDVVRRSEALLSVIVPRGAAEVLARTQPAEAVTRDVVIETAPGAAQLIGAQAPLALRPQEPDGLRAVAPPDPRVLRQAVEGNVTQLSLAVSVVALVIGAVSIGNAAVAGVAARTAEIGLRRAMGARSRHVFAQLLTETTALGLGGGLIGAGIGIGVTVAVALVNRWVPVLDVRLALLAAGTGALAGLLAGLWPAARATRIEPVAALQR